MGELFIVGDGIGAVDLAMRLQQEAPAAGGRVHALIGNHEPLLLAAHKFGGAGSKSSSMLRAGTARGGVPKATKQVSTRFRTKLSRFATQFPPQPLCGLFLLA